MQILARSIVLLLVTAGAASADETVCKELRERGYDACYRQNDTARTDCADRCGRCGEQTVTCYSYCEHFCDASSPEGCGFDLNACVSRCGHHCHEPACEDNPACRSAWCGKDAVKQCTDTCQAEYAAQASCRANWCGDGKARAACMNGCGASRGAADSCRKSWCGDGKPAQQCYHDADVTEEQCRKQADAGYKACTSAKK